MNYKSLVEQIAEVIHHERAGGCEAYTAVFGEPPRLWKTDKPWDSQPTIELCEWERDDYRHQAKAICELLKAKGVIKDFS